MPTANVELWVLLAQDGDIQAFNNIYQHFNKSLIYFAIKQCANQTVAEEAVQEAWIKLSKSISNINDPKILKSWLFKAVYWRIIDLIRQQQRIQNNLQTFEQHMKSEQHLVENTNESTDSLMSLINQLPAIDKDVVHLFYLEDMTLVEISHVLAVPIGTVKSRLNRARHTLKQHIKN